MMLSRTTFLLSLLLLLPLSHLFAQEWLTPVPLASPALAPGMLRGAKVGSAALDTGLVKELPRIPAVGLASYRIEIDTLDFRRKWTLRLRAGGSDWLEVVLRCADTLPPQPRTYDIIILASGRSHADSRYLSGELRLYHPRTKKHFDLGGGLDRVTFGEIRAGSVTGALAVVGVGVDNSDPRLWPVGRLHYRGLEATFTARMAQADARGPQITESDEVRMMGRALDGLFTSWIGAVNGDGLLPDHSPGTVRAFVTRRWGPAIEVDSVEVRGQELWVQLRGKALGSTCAQGTSDLRPACRGSAVRRS